jgi:small subunit ribosomal protein S1
VNGPDQDDFASLFEASQRAKRITGGETIEGTIVSIGSEVALVDVGGKSEAVIDVKELQDDEGRVDVRVGDRIEATVISTAGGLTLSRKLALRAAGARQLEDAFRTALPVEGKVERTVKGGYEVRVARTRAFCPFSQIDVVRTDDPETHVGQVYEFRIIEYRESGKTIVLSRRALLEEQQRAAAAEARKSIVEGAVLTGRVTSVRDFGAFVDLGGGVQGLLHVSEMGWTRVTDPARLYKPGDEVVVKVLRVDPDNERIALGTRQLTDDPWLKVGATFAPGQIHTGRVARVAPFGVLVELEPGIEGLVPPAETGVPRETDLRKAFTVGSEITVAVLEVDAAARRIRLSVNAVQQARESEEARDYASRADTSPDQGFGTLADKLRSVLKPRESRPRRR